MHDQLQDGGHDIIHKRYAMLTAEQKNPASVIESNLLGFFFITVEIHCTYMESKEYFKHNNRNRSSKYINQKCYNEPFR